MLVVAGKFDGRKGWIHNGVVQPKKMVYVILAPIEDLQEISCCIRRTSIREVNFEEEPSSMTAALLKEHTDVAVDMQVLAEKLAEFDDMEPNTEFMEVFWNMWKEAKEKRGQETIRRVRIVSLWEPMQADPTTNNAATIATTPTSNGVADTNSGGAVASNRLPHLIPNIPDGWH